MPRSIWKGSISFGLVHIPVALYAAERRNELQFRLLDRRDLSPVGYRRYNKRTGEEVSSEEIVRGYEYEEDRYVVLTDEDFERADVEATRTVEIVDFVEGGDVDPVYYEKPYYLAPLKGGEKGYALLRETLRRTGRVGIAKVVIRARQYLAALVPGGPVMVLDLFRFAYELRDPNELSVPGDDLGELGISAKELQMAERLVAEMTEPWEPEKYRDDYREAVLEMVREKVESGRTEAVRAPTPEGVEEAGAEVIDIMTLLKRSVQEAADEDGRKAGTAAGRKASGSKKAGGRKKEKKKAA